jgi:hypothetical protein
MSKAATCAEMHTVRSTALFDIATSATFPCVGLVHLYVGTKQVSIGQPRSTLFAAAILWSLPRYMCMQCVQQRTLAMGAHHKKVASNSVPLVLSDSDQIVPCRAVAKNGSTD